jgi:hypothetical protein
MMRRSNSQNLLIVGRLSLAAESPANRAALRRRCRMKSGMKQASTKIGALHSHVSERPSGLRKMAMHANNDPARDNAFSSFERFTRSNGTELSRTPE